MKWYDDPEKVFNVINDAEIKGFGGDCGIAAIAINKSIFNNNGKYFAAINSYLWSKHAIAKGHVMVKYNDHFWDADGNMSLEEFEAQGMLDEIEKDPITHKKLGENAYEVSVIEVHERWVLSNFPDAEPLQVKQTLLEASIRKFGYL